MTVRRALIIEFVVVLIGTLIVVGIFSRAGMRPKPAWFVAGALVVAIVLAGIRVLAGTLAQTDWTEPVPPPRSRAFNSDTRVRMIGSQLRQSTRDPDAFRRSTQPTLAALVAARLQRRHGIDMSYYAGDARAVTGEWLWDLITTTEPRTPTPAEIDRAVEAIENL